ncbi:hypothetical protein PHYSODRAFT_307518 [Phytophthora sojae]|uniref:Uncharacterized protein n=1 Tax=Phytophthora sojae (strain P6497) TaxID=1094619 RepID=G5AEX4_PHYSP|nr:hypothetical protein PHYSODRAFT_307518 [Phytophthora sojae]EGZ05764.1 hypothetical protein PHYSODRAFT_307518 [Phytophthora sojae]|eukprot:XP_009538625.1 hypothetical protein PHYSODRAFT_307518 [Phytophthora sojae]
MELKHEEQHSQMKTMKQEPAELREQNRSQNKYIRHLMGAYWQSAFEAPGAGGRTHAGIQAVAQIIKYIEEDAWGEFDETDKWIVSAYADVSGEIHHDPDWFEALQVYQIGGDPDYRTVFSRLYHRHPTPEELRSVELSLPE